MNDSDDFNNVDDKSETPNGIDTKPSKAARTSDIYERFLDRVQKIDSDISPDFDDNLSQSSSYEPLSEEELRLFSDIEVDYDRDEHNNSSNQLLTADEPELQSADNTLNSDMAFDIDFSDDDRKNEDNGSNDNNVAVLSEVGELNETANDFVNDYSDDEFLTEDTALASTDAPHAIGDSVNDDLSVAEISKDKKLGAIRGRPVNSIKLLIVGMVCGLLLSAAIVVTLNSTGILASLTAKLGTDNSTTPVPNVPAVPVTQPTTEEATTQKASDNTVADASQAASQEAITKQPTPQESVLATDTKSATDGAISNNEKKVTAEKVDAPAKVETKKPTAPLNNNAAISLEDFKQEAENTLYRETKD